METIILLVVSNIFMTFAWYGHLKFKDTPLWTVIIISWLIAFVEYCFQVPANRIGHGQFSAAKSSFCGFYVGGFYRKATEIRLVLCS